VCENKRPEKLRRARGGFVAIAAAASVSRWRFKGRQERGSECVAPSKTGIPRNSQAIDSIAKLTRKSLGFRHLALEATGKGVRGHISGALLQEPIGYSAFSVPRIGTGLSFLF
jgi:hypothetical protein